MQKNMLNSTAKSVSSKLHSNDEDCRRCKSFSHIHQMNDLSRLNINVLVRLTTGHVELRAC